MDRSKDTDMVKTENSEMNGNENADMESNETLQGEEQEFHEKFMKVALEEAENAYALLEVPIGCIIVYKGEIIGKGYNRRNTDKSTFAHAEILAMEEATKVIGDWRLEETTMYVTLEPCPMCAGAIVQARIPQVVIGTMNPKAGCAGSVLNLLDQPGFNHQVHVVYGILQEECKERLQQFFRELREAKKAKKAEKQK